MSNCVEMKLIYGLILEKNNNYDHYDVYNNNYDKVNVGDVC